ncbi:hypothetical protein GW17_00045008 [Ensete ventricosum]|nr:hypothetical protein GW17_00045008 [Ensete ventricosum]
MSGDISRGREKEEEGEEKPAVRRCSSPHAIRCLHNPSPAGDFFSPCGEKERGDLEKFKNYDFGRCPRVYCCGQPCLPVGQSDIPRSSTVKIYCPKCEDIYYPRSKYQGSILF